MERDPSVELRSRYFGVNRPIRLDPVETPLLAFPYRETLFRCAEPIASILASRVLSASQDRLTSPSWKISRSIGSQTGVKPNGALTRLAFSATILEGTHNAQFHR